MLQNSNCAAVESKCSLKVLQRPSSIGSADSGCSLECSQDIHYADKESKESLGALNKDQGRLREVIGTNKSLRLTLSLHNRKFE